MLYIHMFTCRYMLVHLHIYMYTLCNRPNVNMLMFWGIQLSMPKPMPQTLDCSHCSERMPKINNFGLSESDPAKGVYANHEESNDADGRFMEGF